MRKPWVFAIAAVVLAACASAESSDDSGDGSGGDTGSADDPGGGPGPGQEFVDAGPVQACTKMDLVFVVDDSSSMFEEQANLAANFPAFVDVLDAYETGSGAPLDYRIAVTTVSRTLTVQFDEPDPPISVFGPDGAFLMQAGCGMPRRWLERTDPDVANVFACNARVGTGGTGFEMPLDALRMALEVRMADGTNSGFLREDALLAVVLLTDEDDSSVSPAVTTVTTPWDDFSGSVIAPPLESPDSVVAFLDTVAGERGRWAASVIAGPGPGTCTSAFGSAEEGARLRQFVTVAGSNATLSSICEGDLAGGLAAALATFDAACDAFPPIP